MRYPDRLIHHRNDSQVQGLEGGEQQQQPSDRRPRRERTSLRNERGTVQRDRIGACLIVIFFTVFVLVKRMQEDLTADHTGIQASKF